MDRANKRIKQDHDDLYKKNEDQQKELHKKNKEISSLKNELTEKQRKIELLEKEKNEMNQLKKESEFQTVHSLTNILNKKISDEIYKFIEILQEKEKKIQNLELDKMTYIKKILELEKIQEEIEKEDIEKETKGKGKNCK